MNEIMNRNPSYISSDSSSASSSSELSTESAKRRRTAVMHARQQCAKASAAVEEARVVMEARMVDLQVSQKEEGQELSIRANRAYAKAREEYESREDYRDMLLDNYSKLAESEVQATTEREVARYGTLGRFPSTSAIINDGIQEDNPWLDADFGGHFRATPLGNRRRVAKFYKKYTWDRVIATRGRAQCMVTSMWSNSARHVMAGRILPKTTSKSVLESMGLTRAHINDPRNMLLLSRNIKMFFDLQKLTFLLHEEGLPTDVGLCFRLKLWDRRVKDKKIFKGSSMTIGDCDGKMFRFYSDYHIPFLCALSLHAQRSYEYARQKRFIKDEEPRPAEFGSPILGESISYGSEMIDDVASSVSSGEGSDRGLVSEKDSERSVATELLLEPLDYEVKD